MINKLVVIRKAFYSYFSYLCIMPGTNKHIDYFTSCILMPVASNRFTCSFSKFGKKLNYFPTCKDFHN